MRRLILSFFAAAAVVPATLAARPLERGPVRPAPDATAPSEPEAAPEPQQMEPSPIQAERAPMGGRSDDGGFSAPQRDPVREWRPDRDERPGVERASVAPPVREPVASAQDYPRPQLPPRGDGFGRTLERAVTGQIGHRDVARDPRRDWSRDSRRDWSRDWRGDRRYDWRHHRDRNRFTFSLSPYWDPYGLRYRRTHIGWNLRPSYYRSSFWIDDPWRYRLPPAYGPYRWVRYYDDAVLVNIYDGRVADVIYNFFW